MPQRVTKQGKLAAIVCLSSDVNQQLRALEKIRSQDLLRRILVFFVLGRDEMEIQLEDHSPQNVAEIIQALRKRIQWGYFGILNQPLPHMALVQAAVWNKKFLEEVFFARGFHAPCLDPSDADDWRHVTYVRCLQAALLFIDKGRGRLHPDAKSVARRDARLAREVLRNPRSVDAYLFADGIRGESVMIALADKIQAQNPDLAYDLRFWAGLPL